jgi:hypothetical protein
MNAPMPLTSAEINSQIPLFGIYNKTKYLSNKHDSYFQVYEEVFKKYVGQNITFVEIGVLNGGSLFMWRDYFGQGSRIIGVDINPGAKELEKSGFEIFIGSQSDPLFWNDFYQKVGPVDVVLDDGGHTNLQQILTAHSAIPHIKDGGTLVVEDVHTSYFQDFGNPSKYSFVSYAKRMVDAINSRFPAVKVVNNDYGKKVLSITFYESIVAFAIDSRRCFASHVISNNGVSFNAQDLRYKGTAHDTLGQIQFTLYTKLRFLAFFPFVNLIARKCFAAAGWLLAKIETHRLKSFFD